MLIVENPEKSSNKKAQIFHNSGDNQQWTSISTFLFT